MLTFAEVYRCSCSYTAQGKSTEKQSMHFQSTDDTWAKVFENNTVYTKLK